MEQIKIYPKSMKIIMCVILGIWESEVNIIYVVSKLVKRKREKEEKRRFINIFFSFFHWIHILDVSNKNSMWWKQK